MERETEETNLSASLRFSAPVILENTLTILIGMVFSRIVSSISGSALAAIGMANVVMNVITSLFSMLSTGAAVLVARQIGAGEGKEAADTIEQSLLLSVLCTFVITLLGVLLAQPTMRLLMPTAEAQLFAETVRYYRILLLSLPFAILHSVLSSVCRSMGDSRSPMIVGLSLNVVQLISAYIFIRFFKLEEIGAGLAYVCCRIFGTVCMLLPLLRDQRYFTLRLRNLCRPHLATFRRILRIGVPVGIEGLFTQFGYMLANSMSIALGTMEAVVYQIMSTLNNFISLPQGICSTVSLSVVGRLLGANRIRESKKVGLGIWAVGLTATALLGTIAIVFGHPLSALYSSDPAAIHDSAAQMWILLVMDLAGCAINANDPQLRAAGDVKFVMFTTLSAVWLIRLPLTYLFCFKLDMGVIGIFLGNTISLYYRAVIGFVRHYCGTKWLKHKV